MIIREKEFSSAIRHPLFAWIGMYTENAVLTAINHDKKPSPSSHEEINHVPQGEEQQRDIQLHKPDGNITITHSIDRTDPHGMIRETFRRTGEKSFRGAPMDASHTIIYHPNDDTRRTRISTATYHYPTYDKSTTVIYEYHFGQRPTRIRKGELPIKTTIRTTRMNHPKK